MNVMAELLTVCVPTYNRPDFLAQCLESFRAQRFTDFRLVILDNASTLDYQPVLAQCRDPRVSYHRHPENIGVAANFFYAMDHYSQSKYLMIFHDDDLLHPDYLQTAITILEEDDQLVFISSGYQEFAGDPPPFPERLSPELWRFTSAAELALAFVRERANYTFGATIYRAELYQQIHFDPAPCYIYSDRPFVLEWLRFGPAAMLRDPYVLWRMHPQQDTYNPDLTEDHVIRLLQVYRQALAPIWDRHVAYTYYRKSAYFLLQQYFRRLHPGKKGSLGNFLTKAHRAGTLHYGFLPVYPLRQVIEDIKHRPERARMKSG